MTPTPEQALQIYRTMLRIRAFEEKASELFLAGRLPGFLHTYIGQEAVAAGVCVHLTREDTITSTHRGHGHAVAKGARLDMMMAELFAKQTGYCKGKGGSMHIADLDLGILGANGIVGAGIPIAAGAALTAQMQGRSAVTVAFFGDGGSNTGAFHEGLNLAAVWNLPVLFVCENNQYAESTPREVHQKVKDIATRAMAYDVPGVVVDGMDAMAVFAAASQAIQRARAGGGPTLLEAKTYRFMGHYVGDTGAAYRDQVEVERWKQRDPIPLFRRALLEERRVPAAELTGIEAEVQREIAEAVTFAEQSPEPDLEEALRDIFA
ncbi:MAG TPA: thiamine pyrophosphate-dependent dehydrogenase E1 component subunit alpha [Candidatus Methylomirabilis sp.]|jgi:pyruvate dehydrogenase E1 component alpha subunit|nr:thiamine pyrophosphate-dependent dehydrogenase E1 component subunit alpha [Candidatus Methylomirabilis sp.]